MDGCTTPGRSGRCAPRSSLGSLRTALEPHRLAWPLAVPPPRTPLPQAELVGELLQALAPEQAPDAVLAAPPQRSE